MSNPLIRCAVAAVALSAMAACEMGAGLELPSVFSSDGVRSIDVMDGWGTIRAPRGYCVSPETSRPADGFVTMAPCYIAAGSGNAPQYEGLITVQVGAAQSAIVQGNEAEMLAFLQDDAGLTVIADRPGLSTIGGQVHGSVVEILIQEGLSANISGVKPHEWRAFLDVDGRLVTIAVRPFALNPISDSEALELLRTATSRVQR